jgi:hypothetical protein
LPQFTSMLDILEDYCQMRGYEYARLDGTTNRVQRRLDIRRYNLLFAVLLSPMLAMMMMMMMTMMLMMMTMMMRMMMIISSQVQRPRQPALHLSHLYARRRPGD